MKGSAEADFIEGKVSTQVEAIKSESDSAEAEIENAVCVNVEEEVPASINEAGPPSKLPAFDQCSLSSRCRELQQRLEAAVAEGAVDSPPPWKWDLVDFMMDSQKALHEIAFAHSSESHGTWHQLRCTMDQEQDSNTLPRGLVLQCEDLLARREPWLLDFNAEMFAIATKNAELRERLLFEDGAQRWFSGFRGAVIVDMQPLLERHLEMHKRGAKLRRQLDLMDRALRQQGAVKTRRRAFAAATVGEKLQRSLGSLAVAAVAPVPGSIELWLATTAFMWVSMDQAWQHVVYEHPRDAEVDTIQNQFQCLSAKSREALDFWSSMPLAERRGYVLVHNASVRRINFKVELTSCIEGLEGQSSWSKAIELHPLAIVVRKAMNMSTEISEPVVICAHRLAVVKLPPRPDANWAWHGFFSYSDTPVGDSALRGGSAFSFICAESGLRIRDGIGDESRAASCVQSHDEPRGESRLSLRTTIHDEEQCQEGVKRKSRRLQTSVTIVNCMDEAIDARIFESGQNMGTAALLLRNALGEGMISPGYKRQFHMAYTQTEEGAEPEFDVEIRLGFRKAKCEVVGQQIVYVDAMSIDL